MTLTKIGVWCAISQKRLSGLVFFKKSVTAARYQNMMQEFEQEKGYFQHDGAIAHTSLNFPREFYDGRLIAIQTDHIFFFLIRFWKSSTFKP